MTDVTHEDEQSHVAADCPNERIVIREGYCCDCENNNQETSIVDNSKIDGNPCKGCWFFDEKPNWKSKGGRQYYTDDGMLINSECNTI